MPTKNYKVCREVRNTRLEAKGEHSLLVFNLSVATLSAFYFCLKILNRHLKNCRR